MEAKFLVTVGDMPPAMMCETHAHTFEVMMIADNIPHTIYELDDGDGPYVCHACDLQKAKEEADRPQIILPN